MEKLFVDSSWIQQRAYRQIRTNILKQVYNYGLNLTKRDFSISGISEHSLEKLSIGNKLITITVLGNDNVVTGTASVDLIVNSVGIEKL